MSLNPIKILMDKSITAEGCIYGYHFDIDKRSSSAEDAKSKRVINITNMLSYFPIISIATGIFKLAMGLIRNSKDDEMSQLTATQLIMRGTGEIFFYPLFIIFDLAMTILRLKKLSSVEHSTYPKDYILFEKNVTEIELQNLPKSLISLQI